ncbi:MAG: hypothetical protein M0Z36_14455 [Thermaerobacter sp.]|nr:hypothetical protein [Thermaerobacter sp.]
MNRWLLLYSMVVFTAVVVAYIIRFTAPPRWQQALLQLMLRLLTLSFGVFGATYVAAGMPALGWLLIAAATIGSVLVPLRPNADRKVLHSGLT